MNHAEKIAAAIDGLQALVAAAEAEGRDLTEQEEATYAAGLADVAKLKAAQKRAADLAALAAESAASAKPAAAAQIKPGSAALPRAAGDTQATHFENVGEFLYAAVYNNDDPRLASLYAEQRTDSGPKGGFAIPTVYRNEMFAISEQGSIIRPRATVLPRNTPAPDAKIELTALDQRVSTNATGNVYGGVVVTKTAEGGPKPETDADLRLISLEPSELSAHIVTTDKLLRNWTAAGQFFASQLLAAKAGAEDYEFLRGNGIGGPLGILNTGAAYVVTRDTTSEFNRIDAVNMVSRILQRGGSPVWVLSRSAEASLLNMRNEITSPALGGGDGSLVYQPSLVPGQPSTLLGYPVIWNERSPALAAAGGVALIDAKYYLIQDGSGPFVASSEHVQFLNNKTVIKMHWNVDGQPWLTEPFQGEDAYEVSPFVVLDA
jgi:HK97 family phage major capsid protein